MAADCKLFSFENLHLFIIVIAACNEGTTVLKSVFFIVNNKYDTICVYSKSSKSRAKLQVYLDVLKCKCCEMICYDNLFHLFLGYGAPLL